MPTMYGFREYVEAGGLVSYGPNIPDLFRRAADYVDKIMRGAKPADLPVEQPTKLELVINLKQPRRSALPSRPCCSPAPTRWSNETPRGHQPARRRGGWPRAARAQQGERVRRIGVLVTGAESDAEMQARMAAFRQRLDQLDGAEGRNVRIDHRFAYGDPDRHPALARELVGRQPDVLIAYPTPIAAALRRESGSIPIVFANVSDPVGSGRVASLARPGGTSPG